MASATPERATALRMPRRRSAAPSPSPRPPKLSASMGLRLLVPAMGMKEPSSRRAGVGSSGTSSPARAKASVASTPTPPPELSITTRGPRTRRAELVTATSVSRSSAMVSTSCAPAWRQSASKILPDPASDAVCERTARAPASETPALRMTVGFAAAQRRSACAKAGPSGTPSM